MNRALMAISLASLFVVFVSCTKGKIQAVNEGPNPCAEDVGKFCVGVKSGEGRLMRCLDPHLNELTPACKEIQEKRRVWMGLDSPGAVPAVETCMNGAACKKAEDKDEGTNKIAENSKTDSVKMAKTDRSAKNAKRKTVPKATTKAKSH